MSFAADAEIKVWNESFSTSKFIWYIWLCNIYDCMIYMIVCYKWLYVIDDYVVNDCMIFMIAWSEWLYYIYECIIYMIVW